MIPIFHLSLKTSQRYDRSKKVLKGKLFFFYPELYIIFLYFILKVRISKYYICACFCIFFSLATDIHQPIILSNNKMINILSCLMGIKNILYSNDINHDYKFITNYEQLLIPSKMMDVDNTDNKNSVGIDLAESDTETDEDMYIVDSQKSIKISSYVQFKIDIEEVFFVFF